MHRRKEKCIERPSTGKEQTCIHKRQKSFKEHTRNQKSRMMWKVMNLLLSSLISQHRSPSIK